MPGHGHGHGQAPTPLPVVSFRVVENDLLPAAVPGPAQHFGFCTGREWDVAQGDSTGRYLRWLQPMEADLARQVEYDMDEQDQVWLEGINADRKREGEKPVSLEAFEIIIDKLEKEWFDLTKRIPIKASALPSEDSKCAICDDGECENSNAIVFCDGCNLAVHQDCYGVPYIPEGQWLCRKCTVSPDKPVSCVLCPNSYGAFKQTTTGQWAHLLCAIWIPETGVSNTVYMEPIDGVENIPKTRWKLICYLCKKRVGACIQCATRSCFTAFHVTCARDRGLEVKMKAGGERGDELKAYCEKHAEGFVPPEGPMPFEVPAQRSHKRGGGASIVLKRTKTGGPKLVIKQSSNKSARAYKKSYTAGPPLVPAYIFNRMVEYTGKLKMAKKHQFINAVCRYWSLKREARRGAPLLKRLHLEPWTAAASSREQTDADKAKKLELIRHLRNDLEKVRILTEQVRKREKKKLERVQVFKSVVDDYVFSKTKAMRDVLDRIAALDKGGIFATPVTRLQAPTYHEVIKHPMDWQTMKEKLDRHEYFSGKDFRADVDLVISNARKFNPADSHVHIHAVKVNDGAQRILADLDSLDTSDQTAAQHAAEVAELLPTDFIDEMFDYRYYPPEPEPEPSPPPVIEAPVVVPTPPPARDRKKRTADVVGLDDAGPRPSPRATRGTVGAGLVEFEEPIVEMPPPPPPSRVRRRAIGGREAARLKKAAAEAEAEGEAPENGAPSAMEEPSEELLPPKPKKARRERASSGVNPVAGPVVAPAPAPELGTDEVSKRDTFKHFETGWILPQGSSRRRTLPAALGESFVQPVASASRAPKATPSLPAPLAPEPEPPIIEAPLPPPEPLAIAPEPPAIELEPPAIELEPEPLAIEPDLPSPEPEPPAEPEPEPLVVEPPTPDVEPPPPEPPVSPKAPAVVQSTPRKLSKEEKKEKDRLRLQQGRLREKERKALANQAREDKGKGKAVDPPPAAVIIKEEPRRRPRRRPRRGEREIPAVEEEMAVDEEVPGDEEVPVVDDGADVEPPALDVEPPVLDVEPPVSSIESMDIDEGPGVGAADLASAEQDGNGVRGEEAGAALAVGVTAGSGVIPVSPGAPRKRERKRGERLKKRKEPSQQAASVSAQLNAWKARRDELAPSVRVKELSQVPEGTLVWVKYPAFPLWPAETVDPDDALTPPGLLAIPRPSQAQIEKEGDYVLVRFFDIARSGIWSPLRDTYLLRENTDWDELCLDPLAILAKKSSKNKAKIQKDLTDSFDRACAVMEVDTEAPAPEDPSDASAAKTEGEASEPQEGEVSKVQGGVASKPASRQRKNGKKE